MAGQSIMDRVVAARHSIAGQGLAKSVCKATTEEIIGPKKKHLDCELFLFCFGIIVIRLHQDLQHEFPIHLIDIDLF